MGLAPPQPVALSKLGNALLTNPFPYIVFYKLSHSEENYSELIAELRDRSERWCHFVPGVWLVLRRETLADFGQILRGCVLGNDQIVILPAIGPANGLAPAEVWQWIAEFLPPMW
jgi:hypothetical protein